jgi:hypothetical protein
VLALAAQLGLTESQQQRVTAIFEGMSAAAKPLGSEVIAREQALDQLFAKGKSRPIASRRRRLPLVSCKAACGQCICRRIWKPEPC